MQLENPGIKFSDINNLHLLVITIMHGILACFFIFYTGDRLYLILIAGLFIISVMFPLFEKNNFIVRLKGESLYFKKSLFDRPMPINIFDIDKIVPDNGISELYKLDIVLKDKSVFEFQVKVRYRVRLIMVTEFLNQVKNLLT